MTTFWGTYVPVGAGSCVAADNLLEENRARKSATDDSESVSANEAPDPSPIVCSDLRNAELMSNSDSHLPADVLLLVLLRCL